MDRETFSRGQEFRPSLEISVVSPMNNEELCAYEFCTRVDATLNEISDSYEIIIVDDGSIDRTPEILEQLSHKISHLKVLTLSRNCGQWAAMYAGIQQSAGKYVVVMDSDLQNLPEEIPLLIDEIKKGYDLVSGSRKNRSENLFSKRIPSRIANYLIRATTGCDVRDMGGFKCLRGDIARSLRLRAGQHRLLPALVHLMGGNISEVFTQCPPRFAGESHYGFSRSFDVIFDIVMLWFQASFKSRPLYLFGRISLILMGIGTAIISWLLYEKFALDIDMGSRPPFIATVVLVLSSLGFMSVGFILEILSDTLIAVTDRKPYRIKTVDDGQDKSERTFRHAA